MDFLSFSEQLEGIDRHLITFHAAHCINATRKFAECNLCHTICPVGAILPGHPLPKFDESKCSKCKACLPVCPVGAFEAEDSVLPLLKCTSQFHPRCMEIVCQKHPASKDGFTDVEVAFQIRGCLAGLGAGSYLALFAMGAEEIIARLDACEACEWGALHHQIESQIQEAKTFLLAWDWDGNLSSVSTPPKSDSHERPVWNTENLPVSRRDLFRLPSQQSEFALARELAADPEDKRHPSRNRARLMASISKLNKKSPLLKDPYLENLGFASLTVDDTCTACGACSRICPTKALIFESDTKNKIFRLSFAPELCIDCGVCIQACMPHCITLESKPPFHYVFGNEEPLTLREGGLKRCEGCKVWFASDTGDEYCPGCEYRRKNLYGSMIPRDWQPGRIGPYKSNKETRDQAS